jgi:hypothetical protein
VGVVIATLKLSTVGDIAALVAAGAALVTMFFAVKTAGQAQEARTEERQALQAKGVTTGGV